ncbi:hypothetical protein MEBOL_004167 [Melittangium boletus DSM 14713]|uniref:Uncharacterized protein n=1 Tax=Melittangium boletus DSM 14713 TaxID=1294270 RepID=A0A250IIF3_9BACT|nr:hypothetical protein MEBOL_004167 [Melittangium boletus DSM 14713]
MALFLCQAGEEKGVDKIAQWVEFVLFRWNSPVSFPPPLAQGFTGVSQG